MQLELFADYSKAPFGVRPKFTLYINGKDTDDRTHYTCSGCNERIYNLDIGSHFDKETLYHV